MKLKMIIATTALAAVPLVLAENNVTYLATFDGKNKATTWKWRETNDPVMGGLSTGTFTQENGVGVFNGTCAIVPSLKAPGFCTAKTERGFKKFPDGSSYIDGGSFQLRARTSTPEYQGFRVAFGAKNIPRTGGYGGQSFKAGFHMIGTDYQTVDIPLTEFSYDWSGFTGRCDTKDPNGQQHHCCSADDDHKYCPTAAYLASITEVEIWAEGAEGDYHLEIDWIGLGNMSPPAKVCNSTEYCCPDAKHCLTPTKVSCKEDASVCNDPQVCCPLTKLCVDVGAPCVTPCQNSTSYCCPDALACLTPFDAGTFCQSSSDCNKWGDAAICCPLTHECVSVGKKCTPP